MARTKEQLFKAVADAGVVAVIRAQSKDQLLDIAKALLDGGVPAIEVTMSTPKAIAGIEMLADKYGDQAVVGVGTVVFKGDDVLLIRRAKDPGAGTWSLPGGKQELGETVAACALREVREETGIEIALGPLVDVVDAIRTDPAGRVRTHYTLVDFVGEWLAGELTPGDDADACVWAPPAALPGYGLWSETLRIIDLEGNQAAADKYRALIMTKGGLETDADKQALKEAKTGKWPNPFLLKVRLLSDGGYFSKALSMLLTKKAADFTAMEDKLEYAYRLGRIYDESGQDDQAIAMYEVTVKVGANRPEYYAARASLQMGYIYEKRNEKAKAIACYQQCLGMKGHDYKNSLDQRAKAGIQRVNGT